AEWRRAQRAPRAVRPLPKSRPGISRRGLIRAHVNVREGGTMNGSIYEGMIAETTAITGHNGDVIEAYFARPIGSAGVPGVVVLHHMPGWDEWSKEVVRKFAYHGYAALGPHLYSRHGPGRWDDV